MKKSSVLGLRVFTSLFLVLFVFAQPLLAIESLEVRDEVPMVEEDISEDILEEGISDPEEIAKPTPVWNVSGNTAVTTKDVVLGEVYIAPQNSGVTVTFTRLPDVSSTLSVTEILLTDEEVVATGAVSNVAYDISTGMVDGTFEYDLTLPNTGDDSKVVYAENRSGLLSDVNEVSNVVENGDILKVSGLDHFTVFVVVDDGDSNFSASGWSNHPSGYNGDHKWITKDHNGSKADWSYTGDAISNGAVYVSWTQWNDHATNAEYSSTIPGISAFTVNQKLNSGQLSTDGNGVWSGWYRIPGTYSITQNKKVTLQVKNNTNGNLSADAVAFVDLNEAPNTVWVDDNYSLNNAGDHFWGYDAFNNLQNALAGVAEGGTIILESDIHVYQRFQIDKTITLEGNDHIIFSEFAKTNNSNNSAIGVFSKDVVIKDLSIDGTNGTNLHGINIYKAQNIFLDNVRISYNDSAGMTVNGSTVTVNNISTTDNGWGGINIDLGSGVTTPAELSVTGTSRHTELKAIWMDDYRKPVSLNDVVSQYDYVDNGYERIFFLKMPVPTVLGWNVRDSASDSPSLPRPNTELSCNEYTNINGASSHWTDVSGGNSFVKYERQFKYNLGSGWTNWAGSEIYSNAYTNFRTFGSSIGNDGMYDTQVRAFVDLNGNNSIDTNEPRSGWSNGCQITFDKTAPSLSTGLSFSDKGSSEVKMCSAKTSSHVGAIIHWDSSTDINFDHYEYRSFNADGSAGPLRIFTTNSFDTSWWTVPMEGTYGFQVRAVDKAGNVGEWTNTCDINVDWTAPDVTTTGIQYPNATIVNSFVTSYNTPTIIGEIISADTASVQLTVNSQTYDATISGTNWSVNVTHVLPDGTYTMQIVATDDVGNSKTTTQNITIDTKAPTATYTHYNNGVEVLGAQAFVQNLNQLSFTGSYTDFDPSSGLYWDSFVIFDAQADGSFRFSQNGAKAYCSWRKTPNLLALSGTTYDIDTPVAFTDCVSTLPEGTYYMAHHVYDSATRKDIPTINQFRDVLGLKFTVDTTAPKSQFTGADLSGTYHNSPIVFSGESYDVNGVVSVTLLSRPVGSSGDWTIIETIENPSASNTFEWISNPWTPEDNGRYDIKAEATDQAGNTEHSPMMSNITYDTTAPKVKNVDINIDYFGTYVNGKTGFLISVPVSDSLSGIDRNTCEYTIDGAWLPATYAMGNCGMWIDNDRLMDGDNLSISLRVTDRAGNTSTSRVLNREVDKADATSSVNPLNPYYGPLSLPVISGIANDTVSNVTDVKIRMTRSSDGKNWIGRSMWSYLPGLQDVDGTYTWTLNKTLPSMQNGVTYTVTPYAADQVHGLSEGRSDSFTWDSEDPTNPTRIWSTSHNATPNDDTTIDMRFSGASDDLSGVKGYYYSFSQAPETPSQDSRNWLPAWAWKVTSHRLADGVWYFNIITVDNVNNVSNVVSSIAYIIDTQAPNARITAPTSTYLSGEVDVKGTVTDTNPHTYSLNVYNFWNRRVAGTGNVSQTNSFTDSTIYTLDTTQFSDGVYTLRLESRDAAGNQDLGSIDWKVVIIDNTHPTVDLVFDTPGTTNKGFKAVFSENVNEADAENPANYFLNNWPTAGGSGDLVGDANITYNWRTRTATISFTTPDWYISPEQQWGVQNIHDLAGNLIAENPYTEYSTPMVAPITTVSGIDSDWHNSDVTVTLTCTDIDGSGCYQTYYSLNGSSPYVQGNTVVVSEDGLNTLDFYSTDRAGNTENEKTADVIKIDKTIPEITVDEPSTTEPIAGAFTISGTMSDSLSGILGVTLDFGDGALHDATIAGSTWSFNVNDGSYSLLDGTYDVLATATDNAGNTVAETLTGLIVDNTKPTATVLGTLTFITGDTTPRGINLADNNELDRVCYIIDTNTQQCVNIGGTGFFWDVSSLINTLGVGSHTFTYYVVDKAGNQSDSGVIEGENTNYLANITVNDVPAVAGAATTTLFAQAPVETEEETTTEEENTTEDTQTSEEVKGVEDTDSNDEEEAKNTLPWWAYVLGGGVIISFFLFLIWRRRKDKEEKNY